MSHTYRSNGSHVAGDGLRLSQETDDRSFGEIVRDLMNHSRELVRGEVLLVKREMSENVKSMVPPIGMFVGAALLGLVALFLLGHTIAWALNNVMDAGLAYFVTALLFGAIAGGLAFAGKKALDKAQVAPTDSLEDAKEDLQWIKSHAR